MKRTASAGVLVAVSAIVATCSLSESASEPTVRPESGLAKPAVAPPLAPPPVPESTLPIVDQLAEVTGARWVADPHPAGTPSLFLSLTDGRRILQSIRDVEGALAFLEAYRERLGVHEPLANEFEGPTVTGPQFNGCIRFSQHIPGSDVFVFEGYIMIKVAMDGSIGFIESNAASGLERLDPKPHISPERATEIAIATAAPGSDPEVQPPVLGVRAEDPAHPVLIFRVRMYNRRSRRIDVDANTGAILESTTEGGSGPVLSPAESD